MVSFDKALKQHYTDDTVLNMVYQDNPFVAMVDKMEEFDGKNLPIVLIYGNPQGISTTFTNAQARGQVADAQVEAFVLTRVKKYGIATIDNETLQASKTNAGAFMEATTTQIDGILAGLANQLSTEMYRAGFGDIAQVGAISVDTITLLNADDIVNVERNQQLVAAPTQDTSVLRAGAAIVIAVDRSAGTLTLDATANITGLAVGDWLFIAGNRQNSATPTRIVTSGLAAWIPSASPSNSPFFGVNRTTDATRLGGQRIDGTAKPIEEALISAAALVGRESGKVDKFFMSFSKYAELENALGTKVQYVDLTMNAMVGFRGITINGPRGLIQCIPDRNCPSDKIYGLQMNTWKLYTLGKMVAVTDTDGLQMLRQSGADGVEVRYRYYGNLGCKGPGFNVVISV